MKISVMYVDDNYQQFLERQDIVAVNFPIKKSMKIFSDYDKIKYKEKLKLKSEIEEILGFSDPNLDSKEAIENFLVFTYYLLKIKDKLIIFTAGLSYSSIDHYIEVMEVILNSFSNKALYIVKNYPRDTKIL
ncbi:hypothetical protein C8D70_1078 [Chryseobacterium sp. CBTAP 102]|uniref:hypothetical protein n=1 Tax=Chryseobacterium sp. CBTAP 102 TaxID=2135644 RepID=UPI000D751682|nr:hypothetical protein [Chryseobacterium sp. CBTAP 102]PXW14306.1 hypothetical protein C8D70_1078 [Chryseobacterium sp. CBTAP 102]